MELLPKRIDLFKRLPRGALVAEIGTWRGYFAVEILNTCPIGKLFCVDPWTGQSGSYGPTEKTEAEHEEDLAECRHHLRGHLPGGRVEIIRGFSVDVAKNNTTIPLLDAVYVDAAHDYENVFADLVAWSGRLKPGGVLMGHDWTDNAMARENGWGVKRAVADFCQKYGWALTAVTSEDFASFQINRDNWTGAEL
jgi:predicted O-methyltransferase YrrM